MLKKSPIYDIIYIIKFNFIGGCKMSDQKIVNSIFPITSTQNNTRKERTLDKRKKKSLVNKNFFDILHKKCNEIGEEFPYNNTHPK